MWLGYRDQRRSQRIYGHESTGKINRRRNNPPFSRGRWDHILLAHTDEEWKKNGKHALQENVYTKQPRYNQISYILPNNNMAGIATRYVTENELNTEMSIEELSNLPALDILLTDKVKRDQARRRLQKGYNFSKEQVFALIPKLTAGRKKGGALPNVPDTPDITQEAEPDTVNTCQILPKETIRDLAQRIIRDNLGEAEVKFIAKALAESASNASAGLSRISRLRRELRNLKASEKIISATLIPDITRSANKIQKERSKQCEDEGIDYLDHSR
ncbi:uncharacterized protein OCT59_021975 [Rhizophagus irregularis]|uniref:uncharacterized protein n=1 Tax=Rhizophagus irregularis TaxID=588596 RepID=UPI00332D86E6|nr:hypothetical protein OCT59_021975 [Rhizophagus irregularis]